MNSTSTTITITTIDNDDNNCPICLDNPVSLMGPCSHPLCQPCMEKIVLLSSVDYSSSSSSDDTTNNDDFHAAVRDTPTFGFCPMCRKLLYLFDLRRIIVEEDSGGGGGGEEKSGDCSSIGDDGHGGDDDGEDDGGIKNENDKTEIKTVIAYPPDYHWWNYLGGCDYASDGGNALGLESFHFPASSDDDNDDDDNDNDGDNVNDNINESDGTDKQQNHHHHHRRRRRRRQPYLNYSSPRVAHLGWTLDDGSPLPYIKPFDDNSSHYHAASRTFHGRLTWSPPSSSRYGARDYRVVLHFSLDKSIIIGGCFFMMDNHVTTPSYLDGRWKVTWYRRTFRGTLEEDWNTEVITVVAGSFHLFGTRYQLIFNDDEDDNMTRPAVYFRWPADDDNEEGVTQTVVKGVDRLSEPNGPDVGGVVEWETDDNAGNHPLIKWKRLSVGVGSGDDDGGSSTPRVVRLGERFGLDYRLCVGDINS